MFCRTCGKEIHDEAVICPHCGCATAEKPVETAPVAAAPEAQPKNPVSGLCIAGFVLAILSMCVPTLYDLGITAMTMAIVGLILSIIGVVKASKKALRLKGLGIAGIIVSAIAIVVIFIIMLGYIALLMMA